MAEERTTKTLGKGFHIAHLNVRSLLGRYKADMLKHQIEHSKVDVFTVSESWLTPAIPDSQVALQDYSVTRVDRRWGDEGDAGAKKGGGVLSFIKEGIGFSDDKFRDLNVSSKDLEMQWILLTIPNVRPMVIINVYRPPQGDYKKCCSLLSNAFDKAALSDNTDIFLLGDFNIDMGDTNTVESKELNFTTRSLGLAQLVNEPTRISFRNGVAKNSKIDLIFSNSDYVRETATLDLNISDHLAVFLTRKKVQVKREKIDFQGRSYRNYDRQAFQDRLAGRDWTDFFTLRDPDELWESMETKIMEEIDRMCPIKSFKVASISEPWITNEAIEAIKDKDRILRKAKRSGREEDWEEARRVRNRVGRDLEILRADFLKQQQQIHQDDPKKFWSTVATIIPNNKKKHSAIWLKDRNTGRDVAHDEVPNFINTFFTGIGPKLAELHNEHWVYAGTTVHESMGDMTTNLEEVVKLCKDINPMKSSGIDKLSARVCKDAFLVLSDKLLHIFNHSLAANVFPSRWKYAKVVPLFKGGERNDVSNYRPVSLLPLPGKLLEKIVHSRITSFLNGQNFLSQDQGGFRKGFSTLATVADLTDDLFNQINQGMTTLAAFIDLRKAFDTVNLRILSSKLEQAGVRGNALRWCTNYLTNRKQKTTANGKTSPYLPVTCGVPQGSVLGPLFFLIYVNDIGSVLPDCEMKLYADDTVLYQSGENCEIARGKLQNSMDKFAKWCSSNALTINTKKTKLMAFGSRSKVKKCNGTSILLNGDKIKLVPSYKYLGVTLDQTLNYNAHISSTLKVIQHKIALLSKVRRYLNNEVAIQIYKSMILPYFDYADVVYVKANTTELDKLQRLQNKCLKICQGHDKLYGTNRAHIEARVPFLKERRRAHTLNFMYKRKADKPALLNNREIRTRAHDAPLFNVNVPRCEAFKRSVGYFGSVLWNELTPKIRNTNSYLEFKLKQKKEMILTLNLLN